jgi:hypothetical protein
MCHRLRQPLARSSTPLAATGRFFNFSHQRPTTSKKERGDVPSIKGKRRSSPPKTGGLTFQLPESKDIRIFVLRIFMIHRAASNHAWLMHRTQFATC